MLSLNSRSAFLERSFSAAGLQTGQTATATYAHVTPPRSAGTETILLSANWLSRDGGPNLRGVALLLSLGEFLRGASWSHDSFRDRLLILVVGQNHWAFDFVLVVGEDYLTGLEGFMQEYHGLFPGVIWTALNIDYPGHSFSHLGLYYGQSSLPIVFLRLTLNRRGEWPVAEPGHCEHGLARRPVGRRRRASYPFHPFIPSRPATIRPC